MVLNLQKILEAFLYFEWDKTMLCKKNPSFKTQIPNAKAYSILPLGIWYLEFGILDLINAEIYPVRNIVVIIILILNRGGLHA
jgi:hypothetical protein